jgi:hypothetical protein
MIPKSGNRFSEKIMLKRQSRPTAQLREPDKAQHAAL